MVTYRFLRRSCLSRRFFLLSGMAAVLAVNIVIASYAIVAIKEDSVKGDGSSPRPPNATPLKVD